MESHIRGALLLEKEANQFHGEGRLLGARLRRSKASTMRRMADSLQQKAVLLAQQRRGKLRYTQYMSNALVTKAILPKLVQ